MLHKICWHELFFISGLVNYLNLKTQKLKLELLVPLSQVLKLEHHDLHPPWVLTIVLARWRKTQLNLIGQSQLFVPVFILCQLQCDRPSIMVLVALYMRAPLRHVRIIGSFLFMPTAIIMARTISIIWPSPMMIILRSWSSRFLLSKSN